jgi:hypothetical protein
MRLRFEDTPESAGGGGGGVIGSLMARRLSLVVGTDETQ